MPVIPNARLNPTFATQAIGCSIVARREPPIKAFAPAPTPTEASALAPTYVPARAPGRGRVRARTLQDSRPPAVTPTSKPNRVIVPEYRSVLVPELKTHVIR